MADQTNGLILDPEPRGSTLLIAFGGIASQLAGVAPFEFLSALNAHPARRIFVRDIDQCWYQRGVRGVATTLTGTTDALRAIVARERPDRLVTLGTSAGGFGALYFGCALGADVILAFGPQTFTDPWHRRWHRDRRWKHEISQIDELDQGAVCRDLRPVVRSWSMGARPGRIEIHYGRDVRIDRIHARRLGRISSVAVYPHSGGHNTAKALRDRGELDAILARALTPKPADHDAGGPR